MTKKETNNGFNDTGTYHKLSIQVSLNGLSFCILDTIAQSIVLSKNVSFGKELSPYEVQKELKDLFRDEGVLEYSFSEVVLIHRNNLFSLVPKSLFDEGEMANYLKFNAKILANDALAYDEIGTFEIVNVYVPFMNVNNYIYDLFGEFEYLHHGTVLIQALMNSHSEGQDPVCYVHLAEGHLDITILSQKKLLFFNSFKYQTKEDFIYYLMFTLEQLDLDPEEVKVRLFGAIEENDEFYRICYEYIQDLGIYRPDEKIYPAGDEEAQPTDFTLVNAL